MNNNYIYECIKSENNEHQKTLCLCLGMGFYFWGFIFKRLSCLIIWCTLVIHGTICVHKEAKILRGGGGEEGHISLVSKPNAIL